MKQIYKFLGAVAVAAMAFTGCSNDIDEISTPDVNPEGLTLTLEVDANPANVTRTQMNDEGTNVIWSNPEKTNFYGDRKFLGKDVTQTMEGTKVHFKIPIKTPTPKKLDGFFGAEFSWDASIAVNKEYSAFGIKLPALQKVTAKTFDPLADALVMDTKILEGVDLTQPISGITYNRLHAITKLTFKGAEAYAQDKVSKIEFTVSSKDIAGEFAYDYTQKTFVDKAGAATSEPVFSVNPSKAITLECADQPLLDAQFAAWMVMAAVELPQGETVTVKITTDKHIITKTLTIPAAAKFVSTKLNTLSVDLTGAVPVIPEPSSSLTIDLTTKGYVNNTSVTTVAGTEPLSVVFAGAKYYDGGTAVRMYAGNTLTISGKTITKVQFGITTNSKGKKDLKCGGKTINAGCNWTWEDPNGVPEVVFTGTANHTGIQTITVFYK